MMPFSGVLAARGKVQNDSSVGSSRAGHWAGGDRLTAMAEFVDQHPQQDDRSDCRAVFPKRPQRIPRIEAR